MARGAAEAACAFLERAWTEPAEPRERPRLLLELGSAELAAFRPSAADHLSAALTTARDRATRLEAAGVLGIALSAANRVAEAVALLAPVIDGVAARDRERAMRLEAQLFGASQVDLTTAGAGMERIASRRRRLRGTTPGERVLMAGLAFRRAVRGDDLDEAARLAEGALAEGRLLRDCRPEEYPISFAQVALLFSGRLGSALRHVDAADADARTRGSVIGHVLAAGVRAQCLARMGRAAEAEAEARDGLDVALRHGRMPPRPFLAACLAAALLNRAGPAASLAALAEVGAAGDLPPVTFANPLLHSRALARLEDGDPGGALADLEELRRRDELWGVANPTAWPTLATTARALAALGRGDQARAAAALELDRARRAGEPTGEAAALRAAGLVAADGDGLDTLAHAVATARRSESGRELVDCLLALGSATRRAGRAAESREPLREALDLAYRGGALARARRAWDELVAAGARPRRMARSGVDSLTAGERRVAALAAAGRTNTEIAQGLFVTRRTVELHLTHAYRKLGIAAREDLGRAMAPGADPGSRVAGTSAGGRRQGAPGVCPPAREG